MATPSSSATTPSPPLSHLQPNTANARPLADVEDTEERQRAVQKFMARAEFSKLTRALRARLSYASYKATHNVSHVPIRVLEAQTPAPGSSTGKRKAGGNNYYNNPATQGNSAMLSSGPDPKTSMPPPAPRTAYYPNAAINAGLPPSVNANATQSLFSSILAPPAAKRARTIHNPSAPLVAPPSRTPSIISKASTLVHASPKASKSRKHDKQKDKSRLDTDTVLASEESDRKAAEALTSLLRSRPITSMSPRSSISAGSDTGSITSHSHFAQSSARTSFSSALIPPPRSSTPMSSSQGAAAHSTPRTNPANHGLTDNEAAENMLFLATSPSPVRPSASRDMAAHKLLSNELRATGRVLFPGVSSATSQSRDSGGSFSSIGSQMGASQDGENENNTSAEPRNGNTLRSVPGTVPSPPISQRTQSMPSSAAPAMPLSQRIPLLSFPSGSAGNSHGLGPGPTAQVASGNGLPFHLGDFLNVSPSPAAPPPKVGLSSLRVDVGRKLFEEEQSANGGMGKRARFGKEDIGTGGGAGNALGAGIDLVKT